MVYASNSSVTVAGQPLEENSFTYLGSVVDTQGATDEDVRARIGKEIQTCLPDSQESLELQRELKKWKSAKLRILHTSVKSVLHYGFPIWNMESDSSNIQKLQTFIKSCLHKILCSCLPERISNEDLWRIANQEPADSQILKKKSGIG